MPSKETYLNWLLPVLGIVEVVIYFTVLRYFYGIDFEHALIDSAISTTLMALVAWATISLIQAYPTKVGLILYAVFIATVFSFVAVYLNEIILMLLIDSKNKEYMDFLMKSMPIRYGFVWLVCGWISTYIASQKKANEISKKLKNHADAATLVREAELYKLRQQLQPHFLYNSLNSINALVMTEPDKAQEMTGKLSDFLRGSVSRDSRERIPIEEELSYINAYLSIESIRFGHRLNIDIQQKGIEGNEIPPFLLQPILENAIKFGIYGVSGQVDITIDILQEKEQLIISITNPYDPQNQPPRGTGFGLTGISRRLFLIYGRTDLLITHKENNIFTTTLKIPQHDVQSNTDR